MDADLEERVMLSWIWTGDDIDPKDQNTINECEWFQSISSTHLTGFSSSSNCLVQIPRSRSPLARRGAFDSGRDAMNAQVSRA